MYLVPGKRKRRSKNAATPTGTTAKRGRPIISKSSSFSCRKDLATALQTFHRQTNSRIQPISSLSYLEQLPNELIQQIFFNCFEVNLPRCSLRLAEALSTGATYKVLILFAYFDDDEHYPVEKSLFLPAAYRPLALTEKLRLQRAILTCRWCTLEHIVSCMPALSQLRMVQEWHKERDREMRFRDDHLVADAIELIVPNEVFRQLAPLPTLENHEGMIGHFMARAEYRQTAQATIDTPGKMVISETYLPRIVTWSLVAGSHRGSGVVEMHKTIDARASVIAARVLPEKLLRGSPWTSGKVDLLQLLRQGLHSINRDFVLELSAAAMFDGMLCAIEEINIRALLTLLELHNDVFEKSLEEPSQAQLTPPTYHPLPIRLFHAATKMGAQSSRLIWLLIRAGVDSISKDDNVLTAWALQAQTQDAHNEVATWVLNHMAGTNDYQFGHQGYLFVNGGLSLRGSGHHFPPAERQFAQELGYLKGSKTFIPTSLDGSPCG